MDHASREPHRTPLAGGAPSRAAFGLALAILGIAWGCSETQGGPESPTSGTFVVRLILTNELLAPVTIAVNDTAQLILSNERSAELALAPTVEWLTWTSAKAADSVGNRIPDDIGTVQVRVGGMRSPYEFTNVINDTTYVTADLYNTTTARSAIGVYDGTHVSCVSVLRPRSGEVPGFTKIGYYRLLPKTEVRAYRDGSRCEGPYSAWTTKHLAGFVPKSGLVTLTLTSPP